MNENIIPEGISFFDFLFTVLNCVLGTKHWFITSVKLSHLEETLSSKSTLSGPISGTITLGREQNSRHWSGTPFDLQQSK